LPVATLRYDGEAALLHRVCRFHPALGLTKCLVRSLTCSIVSSVSCVLHPTKRAASSVASPLHQAPPASSRERRGQATSSAEAARSLSCSACCGAVRFHNCEAATPEPRSVPRRCPLLVMHFAAPMSDRDMHRTDEASRPRGGELTARSSGLTCSPHAPRALRSFAAGLDIGAFNHLGSIPCPKPSRSRGAIQALFCVPEMWKAHGGWLTGRA
jgi:hypothetical protein